MKPSSAEVWDALKPPSLDDFSALAQAGLASLPPQLRQMAGPVVFRIEDFASEELLNELEIDDPFALTGLYSGDSPLHRSVLDPLAVVPMVFLYRRPILDEWAERGDVSLGELVRHVLVHEIGHFFGLSDRDIETIEARG